MSIHVEVLKTENGRLLTPADRYVVSYRMALSPTDLLADRLVDSSDWYAEPIQVRHQRDDLLQGLEKALRGRKFGDTLNIVLPSEEAFGERGVPGRVPPRATLYVHLEVAGSPS